MTSFNPRLEVTRMIVKRGALEVYNAEFHSGLNIIRGENSSGKSTILDFLFYGLGGELADWRESALLCSEVMLEVAINGHLAVLSREISATSGRPMRILFGDFGNINETSDWALYPYKRSTSKESFSQILFRLMGMPEATGDENNNITMHQVLRLIYADQLSPVDRIFRFEPFDTPLTRQTVGDLLCGAYDDHLYRTQLRLRQANKEYSDATTEWRNLVGAFKSEKHALTLDWVNGERAILQQRLAKTHAEAEALEEQIFNAEVSDGLTLKEQNYAYKELVRAQQTLLKFREERDALQLEFSDSASFINALYTKREQLRDAETTAEALKGISFIYCPSCFAPLEDSAGEHSCALCKSPFDKGRAQARILSVINETGLQLKQSLQLQTERSEELSTLEMKIAEAERFWSGLSERYKLLNRLPSTELRSKARVLYRKAGYLEREIEDIGQKASLIERIDALSTARQNLNVEISTLKDIVEVNERQQSERLRRAYTQISDGTIHFLQRDLQRQDTFSMAQSISFSFGDDRLAVNGESFFSCQFNGLFEK